jgi:hypothetical protein
MADKINREMAEKEFERWAEAMAIDIDEDDMAKDDVDSFREQKSKIVKAIRKGNLVINDKGLAVYTPFRGGEDVNPITFYEPTGADIAAMDKRARGQDHAKTYETYGSITKTHANKFSKMEYPDLKVCQAIVALFLA